MYLKDGSRRPRRGDVDGGGIGARSSLGFGNAGKNRPIQVHRAALLWMHSADNLGPVINGLAQIRFDTAC